MSQAGEDGLLIGDDGLARCGWHGGLADYQTYHDEEWGRPGADDQRLFEKICLEGFQSGLSWITILRKRENFRAGFAGFDFEHVARFDQTDVERLVSDGSIVRHRSKILSTISNAQRALELRSEFGSLATYFWRFEPTPDARPSPISRAVVANMPSTEASTALSKDLKKRGWSFVGPTTAYAFMQSMGMVNDHLVGCAVREIVEQERANFVRPI